MILVNRKWNHWSPFRINSPPPFGHPTFFVSKFPFPFGLWKVRTPLRKGGSDCAKCVSKVMLSIWFEESLIMGIDESCFLDHNCPSIRQDVSHSSQWRCSNILTKSLLLCLHHFYIQFLDAKQNFLFFPKMCCVTTVAFITAISVNIKTFCKLMDAKYLSDSALLSKVAASAL